MKCVGLFAMVTLLFLSVTVTAIAQEKSALVNPAIDMEGYLRVSAEAAK